MRSDVVCFEKIRFRRSKAFTLIELIFVIILVSLITTIAIPKISATLGLNIKSNVLQVAGFLEAGYQHAILSHKKIRMSINMETGEYWAENLAEPNLLPLISESTNLDDALTDFRKRAEEDNSNNEEDKKKKEAAKFSKIEAAVLKSDKINSSIKFKSISFPGKDESMTTGIVSFFISGSGVNDEVIIYLAHGEDNGYSIIFPPMTGKARIEKGEFEATKK